MKLKNIEQLQSLPREHLAQEILAQGTYGDTVGDRWYGCFVGCFARDIDPTATKNLHKIYADHFNFPEWMAHLQDRVFEGLPLDQAKKWHVEVSDAIASNPDRDWDKFLSRTMVRTLKPIEHLSDAAPHIIELHQRVANGGFVTEQEWMVAAAAARAVADNAESYAVVWATEAYDVARAVADAADDDWAVASSVSHAVTAWAATASTYTKFAKIIIEELEAK